MCITVLTLHCSFVVWLVWLSSPQGGWKAVRELEPYLRPELGPSCCASCISDAEVALDLSIWLCQSLERHAPGDLSLRQPGIMSSKLSPASNEGLCCASLSDHNSHTSMQDPARILTTLAMLQCQRSPPKRPGAPRTAAAGCRSSPPSPACSCPQLPGP